MTAFSTAITFSSLFAIIAYVIATRTALVQIKQEQTDDKSVARPLSLAGKIAIGTHCLALLIQAIQNQGFSSSFVDAL